MLVGRCAIVNKPLELSLSGHLRLGLSQRDPRSRPALTPDRPGPFAALDLPHVPAARNSDVHGSDGTALTWERPKRSDPVADRKDQRTAGIQCRPAFADEQVAGPRRKPPCIRAGTGTAVRRG